MALRHGTFGVPGAAKPSDYDEFAQATRRVSNTTGGPHVLNSQTASGNVPSVSLNSIRRRIPHALTSRVEHGKPVTTYRNATIIILDPCDVDGTDNGSPNVTVRAALGRRTFEGKLTTSDICAFMRRAVADSDESEADLVGVRQGTHASPDAIYATYEGSETAQSDTWARTTQTGDGVTVPITTRVVYNDSGDEVLYGFYRTLTFDSSGMLQSVSAETIYTVDTPDNCA